MGNPLEVKVYNDLERALRNLKRKAAQEGIFKELKKRRFHEKPSVRRKKKRLEASRKRT
jgi:small subunit ribosomal protein S21